MDMKSCSTKSIYQAALWNFKLLIYGFFH